MRKGTLIFAALGMLSVACGAHNPGLQKQNDKLALELADMQAESRRERVRVRDLEKRLAMTQAKERKSMASTLRSDRPSLPVEVREPTLTAEADLPEAYEPGVEVMGTNDEGVEIIYVGEAATDKVIKIPPNFGSRDNDYGNRDNDYGYDEEPARPSLRTASLPRSRSLPAAKDRLSVTANVPTIDSQLRQARQPLPMARTRSRSFGDPRAEYQRYYEALRAGNHSYALTGFQNFVERFPGHDFADNAQYWIGETYYDQKRFKSALVEFRKVVDNHPEGNKVPDGLLKLGYCYHQLGELANAEQVWRQVVSLYPKSNPAALARTKLSAL